MGRSRPSCFRTLGDLLGGRPLPEHGDGGVAGDEVDEAEDEDGDAEEDGDDGEAPPDGVAPHRSPPSLGFWLLDLDRVEELRRGRVRHVALHLLREGQRQLGVGDEQPGDVVVEHLLGLLVQLRPLGLVAERLRALQHVGQRRVGVPGLPRHVGRAEEVADEVVGIAVVTGPPDHVEGHLALLRACRCSWPTPPSGAGP